MKTQKGERLSMRRASIVLFAGAALIGAAPAPASPFTLAKGQTELSFIAFLWQINDYFTGDGGNQDLPFEIEQTDVLVGLDHGLSERLTLRLSLPWSRSQRDVVGPDDGLLAVNDGVSDARFGLTWRLNDPQRPMGYALTVGLKWPGDYAVDVVNSPGDGNFDAEVLFSMGRLSDRAAVSVDLGYRFRSGAPADEWLARVEGSWLLGPRFTALAVVDWVDSQGGIGIDPATAGIFFPFTRTEEDALRLTVGGLVSVTESFSLYASWATTVDGKSTAKGPQWGLGTVFSF